RAGAAISPKTRTYTAMTRENISEKYCEGRMAACPACHRIDTTEGAAGSPAAPRISQKRNFAANWICRADPESPVGKRVLEIKPTEVLPTAAECPGGPRSAWWNRLKLSTRGCARAEPAIATFLMNDRSVSPKPGPRIALRPRLPKCATPAELYG